MAQRSRGKLYYTLAGLLLISLALPTVGCGRKRIKELEKELTLCREDSLKLSKQVDILNNMIKEFTILHELKPTKDPKEFAPPDDKDKKKD